MRQQGTGRGKNGGLGYGVGGHCVCTQCGAKVPHERGNPCTQRRCPSCNAAMVREIPQNTKQGGSA